MSRPARSYHPPEGWVVQLDGACGHCARLPSEHSWRCPRCGAFLSSTGDARPYRLCHGEAELACPPEHPWDLVHVLVYSSHDGAIDSGWLQALSKVSEGQAEHALLHQECW